MPHCPSRPRSSAAPGVAGAVHKQARGRALRACLLLTALAGCRNAVVEGPPSAPAAAAGAQAAPGSAPGHESAPLASTESEAAKGARREFSKVFSCPEDRIHVAPSDQPAESPPPEVAADPARLAIWRQNHPHDASEVFDLTGCDRHIVLAYRAYPDNTGFYAPVVDPTARSGRVILDQAVRDKALQELVGAQGRLAHGPHLGIELTPQAGLGLVVLAVLPGGAADGKLRPADVILMAGGDSVADGAALQRAVTSSAGRKLELLIRREGHELTVAVDIPAS